MRSSTNQEHILFQFKQCKGLRGSGKNQQIVILLKVEFNANLLGESSKIDADADSDTIPLDFSCQMNIPLEDPLVFDEIAQKPVVVTLLELLPKDKKAKEEKSVVLGQCCIDVLPLLHGEKTFTVCKLIHISTSAPTSSSLGDPTVQPLAELQLEVSTPKALFTDEKLASSNLLTFCILIYLFFKLYDWSGNAQTHAHTHTHTHNTHNTRTHARTHARTHMHAHTHLRTHTHKTQTRHAHTHTH